MTLLAAAAFSYQGIPRWTLGLDNPNKAAAILAPLLLAMLATALHARRRWISWCCSALAAATGYGLVHTFSRGGLVAFFAGALVLATGLRDGLRRWRRWLPALLAVSLLAVSAAWTGLAGRMAHSSPSADASVGNRLDIWRNVPRMMADAPGGWGHGASGDAFMGWYQPLDRHERYRTLVNSHFTWLVEYGWTVRLCYVWGFLLILGIGIVRLLVRGDPLPLAVWTAFSVAAFFSSVAEEWLAWVVPLAMAVPMCLAFFSQPAAHLRRPVLVATLLASGLLLSAAVVIGKVCRPDGALPIQRSLDGTRMIVGTGMPIGWIVCDAAKMGGPAYGRNLRAFADTPDGRGRAYGLAGNLAAVPKDVRRLTLCGKAADGGPGSLACFASLADLRILSPSHPDEWLAARREKPFIRVFCGEFSPVCPPEDAEGLTVVPGAADYLPDWPRLTFGNCGPSKDSVE